MLYLFLKEKMKLLLSVSFLWHLHKYIRSIMLYFCSGLISTTQRIPIPVLVTVYGNWLCSFQFLVAFISYFLHNCQCTRVVIRFCLIIYRCFANCLHLLAKCMAESFTEWKTLHMEEQSAPSMFAFIQLVLNVWSWALVIIASVFFFIYLDLSHYHETLSAKSTIDLGNFPCKLFSFEMVLFPFSILL